MCSAAVPILPSVLNSTSGQEEHLPLIGIESARFVITSVGFFIAQVSHRISLCAIPVDFKLHHYLNYALLAFSQTDNPNKPTWWNKYQHLAKHGTSGNGGTSSPLSVGSNVDASNECGPQ